MTNTAIKLKSPEEIFALYFERKKSKCLGYSLRALARDIGKSPSFVSQILSGKRKLPADLFATLADILEVDDVARRHLSLSLIFSSSLPDQVKSDLKISLQESQNQNAFLRYQESHLPEFDLLRSWYYIAVLDLASLTNFKPDPICIAKRLSITDYQAKTAISALFASGLLVEQDGKWKKTKKHLRFSTKSSKETVRAFHKQMIEKSITELNTKTDAASFEKRLITGMSVATNPKNLEQAKARLNAMMFELSEILSQGDCTEVYQINAQLFSLTTDTGENDE